MYEHANYKGRYAISASHFLIHAQTLTKLIGEFHLPADVNCGKNGTDHKLTIKLNFLSHLCQ